MQIAELVLNRRDLEIAEVNDQAAVERPSFISGSVNLQGVANAALCSPRCLVKGFDDVFGYFQTTLSRLVFGWVFQNGDNDFIFQK